MKIALIVLPHPYIAHPLKHQPLGILYLAAAIEQAGYDIEVVDLRAIEGDCLAKLPEADVYGMGATTLDYKTALSLAKEIKGRFDNPVILGGVHATALPNTIDPIFDSIVSGEGELAVLDLLHDLEDGKIKNFYRRELIDDIDSIPLPARHLLPYEAIVSTDLMEEGVPATSFLTSRGCPYRCRFCAVSTMWKGRVKYRSVEKVVAEIKEVMTTYHLRHMKFQDDTLTLSKKRLLELCQKLQPLGIEWMANARVDCVDEEMLEAMRDAGCTWIEFGIESASQEALNIINKGFTLDQAETTIREAKSAGLKVKELFMIGLPGENHDISDLDISFISRTDPESAIMATFVPLPGCAMFNNPENYGIKILTHDYDEYLTNLGLRNGELEKGFVYEHPTMSRQEMMWHRERVIEFIKERQL